MPGAADDSHQDVQVKAGEAERSRSSEPQEQIEGGQHTPTAMCAVADRRSRLSKFLQKSASHQQEINWNESNRVVHGSLSVVGNGDVAFPCGVRYRTRCSRNRGRRPHRASNWARTRDLVAKQRDRHHVGWPFSS